MGRAAGSLIAGEAVLVGRDTRRSGEMLSAALQAGFHSAGVDTVDVGVMPSGGISHLTAATSAAMGAVVSASHNPAADNGIKLLGRSGQKLTDAEEDRVELRIRDAGSTATPFGSARFLFNLLPSFESVSYGGPCRDNGPRVSLK
jgi:phosphoglucosamine mutase